MAISKNRKEELVTTYMQLIDESSAIFVTEYSGLNVKALEQLRKEVREANGVYNVTKNTLLELALEQSARPKAHELLTGQIATGFALNEVPTLAKVLVEYAKKEENLKLKGGILGNNILSAEQVEALAKLPSLDQLRGQIIGLISAPAQNIVSTITNGVRQVINVVDAYAKSEDVAEPA